MPIPRNNARHMVFTPMSLDCYSFNSIVAVFHKSSAQQSRSCLDCDAIGIAAARIFGLAKRFR
jgi:hypothetical protein